MDPDAQRLMQMVALANRPPLESLAPTVARALYRDTRQAMQLPPQEVAETRDIDAGGLKLRLYRGLGAEGGELLLFLHGGGWVIGDLTSHDGICRTLANEARCRVLAVDYRLAPEHPFPAAVQDAAAGMAYAVAEAASLGIDPARIAVGGDSAGGNLAAVLARRGRDGDGPPACYQLLLYPVVDLAAESASYAEFTDGVPLTAEAMRWFRRQYVGAGSGTDPDASPIRAPLAGLPPAFVLSTGYDPLRDEAVAYARALQEAGVEVTHLHMATQVHGFLTMSRVIRASTTVLAMAAAALRHGWGGR